MLKKKVFCTGLQSIFKFYIPISKQELHEKFPDISIKTIENVLSTLLNEGKIIKIGSYKDARYKEK